MNSNLPLVLFIDVDGTLIGDISPQVCEWEILSKFDKFKLRAFKAHLIDTLVNGLLRPHIADFLMDVKKKYDHVEFFVYTASNTSWANFLIPCIEKAINMQFQRPYFTRNNCLFKNSEVQKSLDCVLPVVTRRLRTAYPNMNNKMMKNRIGIIDNNNVLVRGETHRCIKCPTYSFVYYYDVLGKMELSTLMKRYVEISEILSNYGLFPRISAKSSFSFRAFLTNYHQKLAECVREHARNLKLSNNDKFWVFLGNIIHKIELEDLKESSIKSINKSIQKQVHKA
jgi:hypothetical protein